MRGGASLYAVKFSAGTQSIVNSIGSRTVGGTCYTVRPRRRQRTDRHNPSLCRLNAKRLRRSCDLDLTLDGSMRRRQSRRDGGLSS